jgi:hypothetical protein
MGTLRPALGPLKRDGREGWHGMVIRTEQEPEIGSLYIQLVTKVSWATTLTVFLDNKEPLANTPQRAAVW